MRWKVSLSRIDKHELGLPTMGDIAKTIQAKLSAAFSPTRLEVEDDSARHHGHAGARPGGESHFNVVIESAAFRGP